MRWGKRNGGFALVGGFVGFVSLFSNSWASTFPKEADTLIQNQSQDSLYRKGWEHAEKKLKAGDQTSAQYALTFAIGSLLPKDGTIPANKIKNRAQKRDTLKWLFAQNPKQFRQTTVDWLQAQQVVIDAVYKKMMDPQTFSDRALRDLSWRRNTLLINAKTKANHELTYLASRLRLADEATLIQFHLEKAMLFQKIVGFVESLMGRYQSAAPRAEQIAVAVDGFFYQGKFREKSVDDEVATNEKISKLDLDENLLRVWVNKQTITATALSTAILVEGIAAFFTGGATAALIPVTLGALRATANGIVIGSSALNLADRVSVDGLSGLWNIESLMDGLVIVGMSSALMPKGLVQTSKVAAVVAKVQKGATYGLTVLFPSMAVYEFANAAAIAKATGRDIAEVRKTALIHLGIGVLGGVPVFMEVRAAIKNRSSLSKTESAKLAEVESQLGIRTVSAKQTTTVTTAVEEAVIQAEYTAKLQQRVSEYRKAVGEVTTAKTETAVGQVLTKAEKVFEETGVRFSKVKIEGMNCLKVAAFPGISYLNTIAFNLAKKVAATDLVFCPAYLVQSGATAGFMSPLVGENVGTAVFMSFDNIAVGRVEGSLAHEVNHAYFYKLRTQSVESPFDVSFFGKQTDELYSGYFSTSELSTYALEVAIDTAAARKAILAGRAPNSAVVAKATSIGNMLSARAVSNTQRILSVLEKQLLNSRLKLVQFECVRLPSGNLAARATVKLSETQSLEVFLFSKEAVQLAQKASKDGNATRSLIATLDKKLQSDLKVYQSMSESFASAASAAEKWSTGRMAWNEELKQILLAPREIARKHTKSVNTSVVNASQTWFEFILSYFRRK